MVLFVLLAPSCGGVPLTAPGGATLVISASPLSIPAVGGVSTITVVATEADSDGGGPVTDGTQIFFTTPIGVIEERVSTENGIARAQLRSDGRSGDAAVVASSGAGATVTLNPPVTIGTSERTTIVLIANPSVARAPDFTSEISATVFDGSGKPLPDVPLVFSTTAGRLASAGSVLRTDRLGRATDRLALGNERLARVTASSGSIVSNAVTVSREDATGPIVTTVSPSRGNLGQTLDVTVSGSGFEAMATVSFGGIPTTVLSITPSAIQVRLVIPSTATPGPVDVTVTIPGGLSDTLPRAFTIAGAGPTVTRVTPARGVVGESLDVTIEGANFETGAGVSFGAGIRVVNVSSVTDTAIRARISIEASARVGARDVTVTNVDGESGTLTGGFTVENRAPVVTSVAPTSAPLNGPRPVQVTIAGSNFQTGAMVSFGADITVTVSSVTATSIVVSLTWDPLVADAGTAREVTVTNPDGKEGKRPNAFTLTP